MAEGSETVQTTVTVKVLIKITVLVCVVLGAVSGPSLLVANSYANQQWVSQETMAALEAKVDSHDRKVGHNGLHRLMEITLCEQRHGDDGWNSLANKCKTPLGIEK